MDFAPLALFFRVSKIYHLEIKYKLGIDQGVHKHTLKFIKHFKGDKNFTDPFDDTLLQIIAWENGVPVGIFRESSAVQPADTSLIGFFRQLLNYHKYHKLIQKQKHANTNR